MRHGGTADSPKALHLRLCQWRVSQPRLMCALIAGWLRCNSRACSSLAFDPQIVAAQQQAAALQAAQQAQKALLQQQQPPQPASVLLTAPPLASPSPPVPTVTAAVPALPHTGPLTPGSASEDVDMASAEAVVAPIVIHNPKEPVSAAHTHARTRVKLHCRGACAACVAHASTHAHLPCTLGPFGDGQAHRRGRLAQACCQRGHAMLSAPQHLQCCRDASARMHALLACTPHTGVHS